jgi:putative tryptophan/tyrosine transport system substrate-binding protein
MRRREFVAGLGSVAALPTVLRAQQPTMPVVGFLSGGRAGGAPHQVAAFQRGMGEHGYVESRNVDVLYRWADYQYDRLPALATDLVRRRVAVIVATGGITSALAAKSATGTIPIVFQLGADPVEFGLVASLSRPGGNITGVSFLTTALVAKRLELLHKMVPSATSIGFLVNRTSPQVQTQMREAEFAARALGVRLVMRDPSTPAEIEETFEILIGQKIGALLVDSDPFFFIQGAQLATLAARHAVPAIYHARETVEAGGLLSYGADISDAYRVAGTYAGRILKGDKAADLPVQQSTKVELVINLKTAKALGLTIPETLLATADEVIQ